MKLSLVWYMSLSAVVHPARGDDVGNVTHLDPGGWLDRPGRPHARLRRKPPLAPTSQSHKTVVIVGAGYAGWGAAHRLVEGGMRAEDITVLEADDDFGGRARKDEEFMPFPLDLGPSWVPVRFRHELAALAGVPVEDLPLTKVNWGSYLWKNPGTYYDFLADNIVAKLDTCQSKAACRKRAKEMDYKFKNKRSEEGVYGCYSKANKNQAFWGGGTDEENYTPLLNGKRERINCNNIHKVYGCQVTAVDYAGAEEVNTTCADGTSFASTQVIVAVPLSVLKDGDIAFAPALPAGIQQDVDARAWFRGFKFFLEFDKGFKPKGVAIFGGGDGFEYENSTGVDLVTGENYAWDYTKYCAPKFKKGKKKRNLVGGYFLGTMADDFDGMNETQLVAEVLEKFATYYSDDDGSYTRGYHPDKYQRHMLVNWENRQEKPFVRGTHSGPNPAFGGHRTDARNKIFVAGEHVPAPFNDFCNSRVECYSLLIWSQLPEEIQDAYGVVGWDQASWDAGSDWPALTNEYWADLTGEQQEALALIGYTQESWDGVEAAAAKAAEVVTYEQEGWVYSALHSGQKAAEMILALQSWADLFPKEDFGTFDGNLGVFQACGDRAQAKGKDNFFLELKAGETTSCATTKSFTLAVGADKIRIAFKLKALRFKNGDFFSVDIATNGDGDYQQILNVGKAASGEGGLLGYAKIPKNKKWFRINHLLDGQKWLEVKLSDLGTDSVDSISLQFTNHAANGKNQKVHLDDVSLQEFVPM